MEFPLPDLSGVVVYRKTGCTFCGKIKTLLSDYGYEYKYINCDEYLLEQRDAFLEFIRGLAGRDYRTFPMVFFHGAFIGGYTDTMKLMIDRENDK